MTEDTTAEYHNPAPIADGPDSPANADETDADKKRQVMTRWARWSISNHVHFTYSEGADRGHMVASEIGSLPQICDCSGFVTGLAKWAGAGDPNGLGYSPVGYTGTLLEHCNKINPSDARMGDLIVYGPGTGTHVVYILERLPKNDFYVASQGGMTLDPSRQLHSTNLAYFDDVARFLRWLS